jgi:hypothetical protein
VCDKSWGPAPVHFLVIFAGLMVVVYLPTHALLSRLYPRRTVSSR